MRRVKGVIRVSFGFRLFRESVEVWSCVFVIRQPVAVEPPDVRGPDQQDSDQPVHGSQLRRSVQDGRDGRDGDKRKEVP